LALLNVPVAIGFSLLLDEDTAFSLPSAA